MSIYKLPVSGDYIAFRVVRRIEHWRVWCQHYYNSAGQEFLDYRGDSEPLGSDADIENTPPGFSWPYLFRDALDEAFACQKAASIIGVESVSQVNAIGNSTREDTSYEIVIPAEDGSTVTYGWRYYTVTSIGIDYCAGSAEYQDDDDLAAMIMPCLIAVGFLASGLLMVTAGNTNRRIR